MNQPEPTNNSNDKIMIILCHVAPLIGAGVILPVIIYMIKKDESYEIAEHAKEALNFQITCMIYAILSIPLFLVFLIGFFTFLAVVCAVTVFSIIAAIKAADGILYEYPCTIRMIK